MASKASGDDYVTKTMYTHANTGLAGALRAREGLSVYQGLGYRVPDVAGIIDDVQPRLEAVIEYFGQLQAQNGSR